MVKRFLGKVENVLALWRYVMGSPSCDEPVEAVTNRDVILAVG